MNVVIVTSDRSILTKLFLEIRLEVLAVLCILFEFYLYDTNNYLDAMRRDVGWFLDFYWFGYDIRLMSASPVDFSSLLLKKSGIMSLVSG